MESALAPFKLEGNAEHCILHQPILPFSQESVPLDSAPESLLHEFSRLGEDKVVIKQTYTEEIFVSGTVSSNQKLAYRVSWICRRLIVDLRIMGHFILEPSQNT